MSTLTSAKTTVCLGPVEEFPAGDRRIVQLGKVSVGVFNVQGQFYAVRNYCPHEGAELCRGKLTGTNEPTTKCGEYHWGREGMILRCPWHAWEFDLSTGESLFDSQYRIKTYEVSIHDGQLWLAEKNRK
jgi:nitrite reductase (NADH) small subunit